VARAKLCAVLDGGSRKNGSDREEKNEFTDMATQSPWQKMLGIELSPVSHRERLVSGLGGFVGIVAVYFASHALGGRRRHRC